MGLSFWYDGTRRAWVSLLWKPIASRGYTNRLRSGLISFSVEGLLSLSAGCGSGSLKRSELQSMKNELTGIGGGELTVGPIADGFD
jgi:hypothetical protein